MRVCKRKEKLSGIGICRHGRREVMEQLGALCHLINKESVKELPRNQLKLKIGKSELSGWQLYIASSLLLKWLIWNQGNRNWIVRTIQNLRLYQQKVKEMTRLIALLKTLSIGLTCTVSTVSRYLKALISLKKITLPAKTSPSFP